MILKLNHLQEKVAASAAQDVVATIYSLLEEGHIGREQFARLQIELDWIQYKQNFRDVVIATQGYNAEGEPAPIMDIHIDTRQVQPGCLRAEMLKAFARAKVRANPGTEAADRLPLEDFQSMRSSLVWEFNRLYWNGTVAAGAGELSKAAWRSVAQRVATMREPDRVTVVNGAAEATSAKRQPQ